MLTKARLLTLLLMIALAFALTGCSDDDDPTNPMSTAKTFTVTIENVSDAADYFGSNVFNTPVGASAPAAIGAGGAYEIRFGAGPGHHLSFATMLVQSNDLFYAPAGTGLDLYPGGIALSGDITNQVMLWDAGTEANEEPGVGANQAPRQAGPNTGPADSDNTVRPVNDSFSYPATASVVQVMLTAHGAGEFTLRVENVSTDQLLAPGVIVVHSDGNPIFTSGAANVGEGLENLAEDGDPSVLRGALAGRTGLAVPMTPGVFVVHASGQPLFASGLPNGGSGLEGLAEDGDPSGLAASVSGAGTFTTPLGADGPGPLLPGHSYQFTVTAEPGARLSLATMFVESNDLFFGFGDTGLALFDGGGNAASGDVSAQVMLWDAGTEANQWPGVGSNQPLRQSAANTGAADANGNVRAVSDGYSYPAVSDVIRVSLMVQ
jgi:hypothetical protein